MTNTFLNWMPRALAAGIALQLSVNCCRAADTHDTNVAARVRVTASWKIALVPHAGTNALDARLRAAQEQVRAAAQPVPRLERLGWLYVAKARASHDAGFYTLAGHCARAMQAAEAKSPAALLLRGHVAQSLHQFKEAEAAARELIERRDFSPDHGLLGDALADQGRLDEAIASYQRMIDLRPDLQSYGRAAHARWLKGDVQGAIEVARLAASAGSPADGESAAWIFTRLAGHEFQAGANARADAAIRNALELEKDYPPALLLRARMRLASGLASNAIADLRIATAANPLPEYQWALADALRLTGRQKEAAAVEVELRRTGPAADPRTLALFLATRGEQGALAVRLAQEELTERGDVFTHDALAWTLHSAGRSAEAWPAMERALAEGTRDARLFLHAAVLAARLGRADAPHRFAQAHELEHLLLPSERRHLQDLPPCAPERAAAR